MVVIVGIALLLPWRRVHPLLVVVLAFGTVSAVEIVALVRDVEWDGLNTGVFVLLLPYALHAVGLRTRGRRSVSSSCRSRWS